MLGSWLTTTDPGAVLEAMHPAQHHNLRQGPRRVKQSQRGLFPLGQDVFVYGCLTETRPQTVFQRRTAWFRHSSDGQVAPTTAFALRHFCAQPASYSCTDAHATDAFRR